MSRSPAGNTSFVSRVRFMRVAAARALSACVITAVASLAPAAVAAPPDPDTLELPESGVRADAAAPGAAAQRPYRLGEEELGRFASLEDALASLPGFRVRRQDGLGGYSELRFRGARAEQVDVTVDGIRLDRDGDAATDLGRWPLLWFTSLEAGAADDGDASPGTLGRVALSTRPAGSDGSASLRARIGSFGAVEAALSTQAATAGGWNWSVGAQGQAARNDYRFFSDNGTLYNTSDDATWRLENNGYHSRGARASLGRDVPAGSQVASVLWLETRKEYPGLFPAQARAYGTRSEWMAAWRMDRTDGPYTWNAGLQARRAEDGYRDPGQSLGYLSYEAARAALGGEADVGVGRTLGTRAAALVDVRVRGDASGPRVTPYSDAHAAPDARRFETQIGIGIDARPARHFAASVHLRQSHARFRADGLVDDDSTGRLASVVSSPRAVRARLGWSAGAHAATVAVRYEQRAPGSGELLGDNLGVKPKLDLKPEATRAASFSYDWSAPSASLRATVFGHLYEDPIRLRAHSASPFLRHENGADYQSVGIEARAAASARWFEGAASATLQRAEILQGLYAGNAPGYETPLEAYVECFARPLAGVRLGPVARFHGPYYPGDANVSGTSRPGEWELDLHASAARGAARASFDARNLTDRRTRDFAFSPRSGRRYSFSLALDL